MSAAEVPWTRGPYEVHDEYEIVGHDGPIANVLTSDDFPCLEDETREPFDDEARATAKLLAGSPAMADVIRDMLVAFAEGVEWTDEKRKAYEAANAILASIGHPAAVVAGTT